MISNDSFPPVMAGGVRTAQFVKFLEKFGHKITVYKFDPYLKKDYSKYNSMNLNITYIPIYESIFKMKADFDVIANMDPVISNLPVLYYRYIHNVPILSDFQDPFDEWRVFKYALGKEIFGSIYRRSLWITTTHNLLKNQLINNLNVNPDIISIINNGVDMDVYNEMNLEKTIDVLYTGSPFSSETLIEKVRSICIKNNKNFLWTPKDKRYPSDNMPLILNKAKICILPAEKGHWHNKLMEYLACGCVVVSLRTEQTEKVIIDGYNGLLANNEKDFIEKILFLLTNENLQINIMKNARSSVMQYSWQKMAKEFEMYLLKIKRDH